MDSRDIRQEKADGTVLVGTALVAPHLNHCLMIVIMSSIVESRTNDEMLTILKTVKPID